MNLNLIAILLSFAMMLTGVGGEGQPAAASRNLVLHNVVVTYNGETLRLGHQVRMGVSADGEKAVYDFGVDLGDERLLPIQVGVSEEGVTALLSESDLAVTVTAKAIDGAMEQVNQMMEASMGEAQAQNPELVRFVTEEFMPAYINVIRAAMDAKQRDEITVLCKAAYDKAVDRGEGTPEVAEIDGETYDVTAYSYSLDNEKLAALAEAVYSAAPVLSDYYGAMFKLYDLLPEESGLNGIDSYAALFEKTGIRMRLDLEEKINEEMGIDIMDGALTIDMSGMVTSMAQAGPIPVEIEDAEAAEAAPEATEAPVEEVEIEPLVMNIHSAKVGDFEESNVSFDYTMDGQGIDMTLRSDRDSGAQDAEMTVIATEDGKKVMGCKMSLFAAEDGEGGNSYSATLRTVVQDQAWVDASFYGMCAADGTSENSVAVNTRTPAGNVGVSFDLDVTSEAIVDAANGHKAAYVIDDLSEASLEALGEDATFQAVMMKALGSLSLDAAKLAGDGNLQNLMTLLRGEALPIDVDDLEKDEYGLGYDGGEGDVDEYTYVIEDDDLLTYDDEPVEDDGVLAFAEPGFSWLPQGWSVASIDVDTAYDWVEMSIIDENGGECAYAIFFPDPEAETTNYIVQDDGTVVDGREINVTDFDEGGLSVTLREAGLYANMMFASEAIDVETIGRIIAGMQF